MTETNLVYNTNYVILLSKKYFANLHKLIEAFALRPVLKRRKFQPRRTISEELTLRRGLPYSG